MMTLEKAIAFNASYRESWREYFNSLNRAQLTETLVSLTSGMDRESKLLCEKQVELVPYMLPHELLGNVFIAHDFRRSLLPEKTASALEKVGFFTNLQAELDRFQRELDLPEEPIPEILMHSGLKYIPQEAKAFINGKAVIDGGAYIGDTAKLFCRNYGASQVYALEPEPTTYETLAGLVERWCLETAIVPLQRLLGDKVGQEVLWGEGVGASTIRKAGVANVKSELIECTTIDTLVEEFEIPAVGMIKLDVEGNEFAAIAGAINTIKRDKPLMLISIYHTARDFFEIKPTIDNLNLGYQFLVRKVTDDIMKELILIAWPRGGDS